MSTRTKWGVVNLVCPSYAVRDGKMSWTYDKAKAEDAAKMVGGVVVDAEEFAKNPTEFFKRNKSKEIITT